MNNKVKQLEKWQHKTLIIDNLAFNFTALLATEQGFVLVWVVSRKQLRSAGFSSKHLLAHFREDLILNSLEGFLFVKTANLL